MVKRLPLAIGVALAGSLATVSTAHADSIDDKFVAKLEAIGIYDQISNAHEINAGHFVCVKLDNGFSPTDVLTDVAQSSGIPEYHAGYFVGASIDAYCPRHKADIPTE